MVDFHDALHAAPRPRRERDDPYGFAFGAPRTDSGYAPVIRPETEDTHKSFLDSWSNVASHAGTMLGAAAAFGPYTWWGPNDEEDNSRAESLIRAGVDTFDPTIPENIINAVFPTTGAVPGMQWGGLVTGPRVMDTFGHEERMGFGHPEKEFDSVVPGFTVRRLANNDPSISMSGHPITHHRQSASQRGDSMGYATRETERWGGALDQDREIPVSYAWIKNDTGEVVAKLDTRMSPGSQTYVDYAAVKPEYQRGPIAKQYGTAHFIKDIYRIVAGAGVEVDASLANAKLGEKLGRRGATDPMFRRFVDEWGVDPSERRVTPFGQAHAVDQPREGYDPNAWEAEHPSPSFYNDPDPVGGYAWGSNIPGNQITHQGGQPLGHLAATLETRLENEGFGSWVNEIHDANIMSPRDRALIYVEHMADHPDYSRAQVAHWRGRLTRAGYVRQTPSLSTAQRELYARLEADGWQSETGRIRAATQQGTHPQRQERRVASMLQFMREQGYHPLTIALYERFVPPEQLERIRAMRDLGRTPQVLSVNEAEARISGTERPNPQGIAMSDGAEEMAGWLIAHGYTQDMSIIAMRNRNNPAERVRQYYEIIRRDPHITSQELRNFSNMLPAGESYGVHAPRSAAGAEMETRPFEGWAVADMRVAMALREMGYPSIVNQIRDEHPLRGTFDEQRVDSYHRVHEMLDFMESARIDPERLGNFRSRLPDPPSQVVAPRPRVAREARMREIEDEMDSIGHYPEPGSSAFHRYQALGEEWSNLAYGAEGGAGPAPIAPETQLEQPRVVPGLSDLDRRHAEIIALPPQERMEAIAGEINRLESEPLTREIQDRIDLLESWRRRTENPIPQATRGSHLPGEVSWPNAAFHAYNQLVRDGLGDLAQRRTLGMQSADDRFAEYMAIMREQHYTSVITDSYWALSPTDTGRLIRESRSSWPQG